jgi:hypothetical protein
MQAAPAPAASALVESARNAAFIEFREALLTFSASPTPPNLVRYLNASRGLDAAANRDSSRAR